MAALRQRILTLAIGLPAWWAFVAPAFASAPAEAGFEPAAECVAVLKQDLKSRLHPAPAAAEKDRWKQQAESAFAYAGGAYQAGVTEERARAMLDQAEEAVRIWPADKVARQASTCLQHGHQLLTAASVLEKMVIRTAADRWLTKELRKLDTATAP